MKGINALFVDDDQTTHMIAHSLLPRQGVNVHGALNTTQADAILHREKIDIIICDVLMPKEDGLSYCKRLRKEGCQIPVFFLSALGDPTVISRGLSAGAEDYLVKPIDLRDLHSRITRLLGNPAQSEKVAEPPKKSWFSRLL